MALKNHALDDGILQAEKAEFLEKGYETASLRKIAAQAGVTIGAIYTRYSTKDQLFCALVQPLPSAAVMIRNCGKCCRQEKTPDAVKNCRISS